MVKIQNGEITIHKGDSFSLLCVSDTDINPNRLEFFIINENGTTISHRNAQKHENGVYFIFNSKSTKLSPGWYTYFVRYTIDEQNVITTNQNVLKVLNSPF